MLRIDIIGLIELVLIVWALVGILQSSASTGEKLVWSLVVILLPIVGFILWYFIGPGSKSFPGRR